LALYFCHSNDDLDFFCICYGWEVDDDDVSFKLSVVFESHPPTAAYINSRRRIQSKEKMKMKEMKAFSFTSQILVFFCNFVAVLSSKFSSDSFNFLPLPI
jgi:hypothetical protein